jgi:hypothetical protein
MYLVIFYLNVMLFLYAGLFFQLNIGHIGLPCLCSFIVPYKHGALGFMFVYLSFSSYFIMLLHLLICFHFFVWCLFVTSFGSVVKLLAFINSSIFFIYSSLCIITSVSFISFCYYQMIIFYFFVFLYLCYSFLDISLFNSFCKLFAISWHI